MRFLKRSVLVIAAACSLAALAGCEERKVHSEKRLVVQVTAVHNRSKSNSTVDLKEVSTGYLWRNQRLSCSQSRARNVKIGKKWDVTEVTYFYPESQRFSSSLISTSSICDKSN